MTLVLIASSLRYLRDFWMLSFVYSFQLHIGLLAALAAIVATVLLRSRYAIVLFVWSITLAGHAIILNREFLTPASAAATGQPFKLISFNVFNENHDYAGRVADMVIGSGADAVYLMEAESLAPYLEKIAATYPYRLGCGQATDTCDLLMLSRYPLENGRFYSLSDLRRDRFAIATVNVGGTTINLAATHLSKPYFDDYHTEELEEMSDIFRNVKGPLILAGDFNSSGIAPDMRNFIRYNDFYAGPSEPATWPIVADKLGIAIDHVYARQPARFTTLQRMPDNLGSNHFGLIADFLIARP
jgi:endonuclease/exonuclease/phosphatase (EEP) superfamily protein YafD